MSAYVVDPTTINRVLTFLNQEMWSNSHIGCHSQRLLRVIEWDIEDETQLADLGQAMYNLNANAVQQRYGDKDTKSLPGLIGEDGNLAPFKYESARCTIHQALKSLVCWYYQCSEGNVPEHALYKVFKEIRAVITDHIVTRLPEYESAQWG